MDADYAGCLDDRKSTTGYVFLFNGNPISWKTQKQSIVAQSTTEAEYIGLVTVSREMIWLRGILEDLGHPQEGPTIIREDNIGAIHLTRNPVFHQRTKHIDVRYHLVRDYIERNLLEVEYCETNNMLADFFTKALPKAKFQQLRNKINIWKRWGDLLDM